MEDSPLRSKSFAFATDVVEFCRIVMKREREYVLTKQLLSAGTSIGANIEEAIQAQSRADFVSKMSIALKEAYESRYWIRLMLASRLCKFSESQSFFNSLDEIIRMLVCTVKTARKDLIK